jgi:predicted DCC family thiol-disulfide oxidoreductase YuxK
MPQPRPTLVFDGDCGICRTWVEYWRALTGDAVVYRPYQEAAADFPAIPVGDFQRAMTFIEPDTKPGGRVTAGAAATFRLLTYAPSRSAWWWLYSNVPGVAFLSEAAYTFLSRRRGPLSFLTRLLWGIPLEPERYQLVSWLFLRGLGLIYVAAFCSLAVQVLGLVGSDGIVPLPEYLAAAHAGLGSAAYWRLPTLFWFNSSDTALIAATWAGVALGALVTIGLFVRPALIALYVLYLSCVYAGQIFFNFQWDMLLLESGFLAIFLTGGSRFVVWLYRLLLFRFVFLSGVVKYVSGDPTWRHFTALDYHFWTQPLPSPLAWYAGHLPHAVLAAMTAGTLIVELFLAFLIFLPRRPRAIGAFIILAFQLGIVATGSYNFFNLLSMLLCLFLLDDAALRSVLPCGLVARVYLRAPRPGRTATVLATLLALMVVPVGLNLIWEPLTGRNLPVVGTLAEAVSPFAIVNPYGVFAVMTTTRPEIVIEGSDDGKTWRAYDLPYKPGPVERPLSWNIPYQPRLDWQLWFAAFEGLGRNLWIERLMLRLLEGSKPVLALFSTNPFPGHPPKYVGAELFDYRFSDPDLKAKTGQPWVRRLQGNYFPRVSLGDFARGPLKSAAPPGPGPGAVPGPAQIGPQIP